MEALVGFWDWTDPFVNFWRSIFHLPDDMMRLSICLIAVYVLSYAHRYLLKTTNLRLIVSLVAGLFLAFFCFKWEAMHYVIAATGTYLLCAVAPTKYMPWLVVIWTFGYLSYGHLDRYMNLYLQYTVNWSTPMMLVVIKLQSFAWSYYDGQLEKPMHPRLPAGNRITKLPSPLEYYSFVFFFAGFLSGPVGEFNDYIAFTNRSMFKDEPKGEMPDTLTPAIRKAAWMFLGIIGFYSTKLMPEAYCGTAEFLDNPLWYRFVYMFFAAELGFTKYYFAWYNGEAATILTGFAYSGRNKKGDVEFNRVRMLNLPGFRFAHNRFMIHANWNICSGEWLKNYIYFRIPAGAAKVLNPTMVTFMTSAFWHGFYPGYYIFFFFYAFYYLVEEQIDRKFKRVFITNPERPASPAIQMAYTVVMTAATWIYINTIVISFRLLDLERTLIAFGAVYYDAIVIAVLVYVVFKYLVPMPPRPAPAPSAPAKKQQ